MLAIVDYYHKFIFIDVGCQGRISDGGVYNNSSLSNAIENNLLDLPLSCWLPVSEDPEWIHDHETDCFPFMIVADDVFPLKPQIMKPYSHRNLDDKKLLFNWLGSRYRRVTENAFDILSCRFRLFLAQTCLSPETAIDLVLAAVTLHNVLRTKPRDSYSSPEIFDEEINFQIVRPGSWRSDASSSVFMSLQSGRQNNRCSKNAEEIRDGLVEYFYGPGAVPWQWGLLAYVTFMYLFGGTRITGNVKY